MEAPLNRIVLEQEVPHPSRGLLREGGVLTSSLLFLLW